MASEELEAFIQRMIDDPDSVREEMVDRIIAENGWAWYWSNEKYLSNLWIAACELDGFKPTKPRPTND
jgi:hypothetical protein